MSLTRTVTLHCDICGQWTDGAEHCQRAKPLREWAVKNGWRRVFGVDYCPDPACQAEAEKWGGENK